MGCGGFLYSPLEDPKAGRASAVTCCGDELDGTRVRDEESEGSVEIE